MHIDRPGRVSQGVFDFCALEGLGAWLVARQPQLGSSQQLLLFDLIVPNEPGYVANVFDLRVPAVWVPCIQQHVALPPILSLLLACESFRRTHAWRPANHLWAGEAAPQRRGDPPCLAPASRCARSRSSVGHRARPPFSRISTPEQGARRSPAARGRRQHGRCAGARAWPTVGESGGLAQAHAEVAVARDRACCRGSRSRTLNE